MSRHGTPLERLLRSAVRDGDCLSWQGRKNQDGYPLFYAEGKVHSAHRWAYERERGPIPAGMQLDHTCWNRSCIEISHLRLASPEQNAASRQGANVTNRSTGARNVYRQGDGYTVRIRKRGELINFGTYPTIAEAASVAEARRRSLFGEFSGRGSRAEQTTNTNIGEN